MFCPSCKCEFRPSFTRCASCDVDLVDDLAAVEAPAARAPAPAPTARVPMGQVCGYFELEEAREARDRLHEEGIAAEIVIRASPDTPPGTEVVEEYWLLADARQGNRVAALIGPDPEPEDDGFKCSNCGRPVREEESFCANCGMRFSG